MNMRSDGSGYTIIEVLIFIVVSGFILMSALVLFNGRQEQVQYEQGVRNLDFKIQDTINDIANGHFIKTGYLCETGDDSLIVRAGEERHGASDHCVFAGKAIQREGQQSYSITSILAAKPDKIGTPMNLADESAKLTPFRDRTEVFNTSWGLKIVDMVDSAGNSVHAVLFLSELGRARAGSETIIGSGVQAINLYTTGSLDAPIQVASQQPIYICLEGQRSNKRAVITLGADGRELTTSINQDAADSEWPC